MTTTTVDRVGGSMATTRADTVDRANRSSADWRDMLDLATELANVEGFVPKALLGRPPAILATLLAGRELGLGPMGALRSLYIIDGKPTLSAEVARALVYAAGHSLDVDVSDTRALARGRRNGETRWTEIEWTLDRARRAKLADRQAWRLYPRAMLAARATSELAHLKFSDVLAGLEISEAVEVEEPSELPPMTRRKRVQSVPVSSPENPLERPLPRSAANPPARTAEPSDPSEESVLGVGSPSLGLVDEEPSDEVPQDAAFSSSSANPAGPVDLDDVARKRLHARMSETFPDADRETLDRLRHSIVAVVTRDRPDGPVQSSNELTDAERMGFDALLNYVRTGECVPDIEPTQIGFRIWGRTYLVALDPPSVYVGVEE